MGIVDQRVSLVVVAVLVGCGGSPFEQGSPAAAELAGAAGAAGAVSIGSGGSSLPSGAAGVSGRPNASAGSSSGGTGGELEQAAGGAGGEPEPSNAGGTGGANSGGTSGVSHGGVASCLRDWQGSSCDSCAKSPAPPVGSETCAEVLACYVANGGPANCDYAAPTADAVVKVAHDVLACRCP